MCNLPNLTLQKPSWPRRRKLSKAKSVREAFGSSALEVPLGQIRCEAFDNLMSRIIQSYEIILIKLVDLMNHMNPT